MDINQNQQTNTFVKGMNTDTSDMYLSSDQYRYAENVRVVTNEDSNSGELHLIEGTTEYKEIKGQYIIASDYIRDIAVFITVNNNTAPTEWSVYKIENDTACLMFGPSQEKIWNDNTTLNDIRKSITTVMRYESPENIKLYIADSTGKHSIMCLNVSGEGGDNSRYHGKTFDEVFSYQRTLLPPPTVEISNGSGNIMSGRVQYAYRLYSKNNPATQISILSKVLNLYKNEYSGYEAEKQSGRSVDITLDVQSQQGLDYIQIYRISYQLSGQLPKISLIKDEKVSSTLRDNGSDIEEVAVSDFLSMVASSIIPSQIESKGDYLFAANMKYSQDNVDDQLSDFDARSYSTGNTYDETDIFTLIDGNYTSYGINFDNFSDLSKLKHNQFDQQNSNWNNNNWKEIYPNIINITGTTGTIISFSTIEECYNKNYPLHVQFPDNTNDLVEIDIQVSFDTYKISDNTYYDTIQNSWYNNIISTSQTTDIINILKQTVNSNTIPVEYPYATPPTKRGDITIEAIRIHASSDSSSNSIQYYINSTLNEWYNGYGKCICWKYTYDPINITAQNQGNIQYQKSTFRCGETYRFGVRLFDQHGNASSVKWIADIMIPDGANIYDDNGTTKFRNVGIEFFKTPGSESLWEGISGWEIVRCERTLQDKKAITQGIIGFPVKKYSLNYDGSSISNIIDKKLICGPGFLSTDFVYGLDHSNYSEQTGTRNHIETTNNIIMFSSPEYCYQPDDIKDILNSTSNIYISEIYKGRSFEEIVQTPQGQLPTTTQQNNNYFQNSYMPVYFNAGASNYIDLISSNAQFKFETGKFLYLDFYHSANRNGGGRYGDTIVDSSGSSVITVNFVNNFQLDYSTITKLQQDKHDIGEIQYTDSPEAKEFEKNEVLTYKNNAYTIGQLQYINWEVPYIMGESGETETQLKRIWDNYTNVNGKVVSDTWQERMAIGPIGAGGRYILLEQTGNNKLEITHPENNETPSITVVNINKSVQPYGGYNKTSIENSNYISFGDYTTNTSIQVYSGDTKNTIFTFHAYHIWYSSVFKNIGKQACIYTIPVESDIDIHAQYGLLYGVDNFWDYRIQDKADGFDSYTQDKDAYLYNTAYNATPDIVSWTTPERLESKQDYFDTRIHFSNVKTNNEDIDSWLQFAPSNYRDVDSRYGEITDLKLFKDRLIFWQENATGVLAVNERVVLNDQNDTQVVLGTGGVLERYDYITTIYGQKKNQHARVVTNDSLYWWDGNNKEILVHQQKFDSTPLSTIKYIKNHINKKPESDTPFISYDNKYKEVLFNVVNNQSIVYNEQIQAFTGIYTFNPLYDFILNGDLYLTDNSTVYKYNDQYINQTTEKQESKLFKTPIHPLVRYVVNKEPVYTKAYDIQLVGGRFYGGGFDDDLHERNNDALEDINLIYKTPLKQEGRSIGTDMTNVEYDYRITVPRAGGYETTENDQTVWKVKEYGDRLRGKVMRCEINSDNSNPDFSLQYITTKFRMSWN